MNEVFNMGVTFYQLLVTILLIIFGSVFVKISLSFDLNRYLEKRQETLLKRLKNACPHFEVTPLGGDQVEVRSLFVSPPGAWMYRCGRCKLVTDLDLEQHARRGDYYLDNLDEYIKARKKFDKLLKKSGQA